MASWKFVHLSFYSLHNGFFLVFLNIYLTFVCSIQKKIKRETREKNNELDCINNKKDYDKNYSRKTVWVTCLSERESFWDDTDREINLLIGLSNR